MRKPVAFFVGLGLLWATSTALADFRPIDDPVEESSWSQAFRENGVGYFDLVAVQMVSGPDTSSSDKAPSGLDSFKSFTHSGFNKPGWSTTYENASVYPTFATAIGSAVTDMTWTIKFAGTKSNLLAFDFVAFNGSNLVESARASWNGAGWLIVAGQWNPSRAQVVPVPATILLGLLGFGYAGRKLRKMV